MTRSAKQKRPSKAQAESPVTPERIQKVLSQAGLGSRRQIDAWIAEGLIKVNGQLAELGQRITVQDTVLLRGRPLRLDKRIPQDTQVLLYHKPVGELTTRHDPEGRRTVFDKLPKPVKGRWVVIGRLDINTSGLLLFTNDGDCAHKLMHTKFSHEREYAVRILGEVSSETLQRLRRGVKLEDGMARFDSIDVGGGSGANRWYHVVVSEGRNRIVRRLWESQGVTVSRLIRTRFGKVRLPDDLPRGRYRYLKDHSMLGLDEAEVRD